MWNWIMQGASWAEAVTLIRAYNTHADDRQRPCGWTKTVSKWHEVKHIPQVPTGDVVEGPASASGVTPAAEQDTQDTAVSGVTPPAVTDTQYVIMSGDTPAMSSGSAVADPVEGPALSTQGGAFSVVFNPLGLRSSEEAQEAFRETAARMTEIGAIPQKIEVWGDVTDAEEPVHGGYNTRRTTIYKFG